MASTLFLRSYLITLGLILASGGFGAILLEQSGQLSLAWWGVVIALAIGVLGLALLLVGAFGSTLRVELWADRASIHEGSVVVALIALPLFLVLRLFMRADRRPSPSGPIAEIRSKRARRRRKGRQRS